MSYLGLDLGTSGLRGLLIDQNGGLIGAAEHHYNVSQPHPGWSEQNPADWIEAVEHVAAELSSRFPAFADLQGIGVSGHMHGATLLDDNGNVIRPCILWNDTRAAVEAASIDRTENVRALSGNIVFPGFTSPKLLWVQKHEPKNFSRIAMVLLPAAYLNFYLTGDYVSDMSDSSGTSWLDVGKREWSDYLLQTGAMQRTQIPSLVEGSARAGILRKNLAQQWGIKHDVSVAGGAGDNAAAACGMGTLTEGQGFVSLGTSGVILAARNGYAPAPETAVHTFCHALPDRWYQMGVMLSATNSLNWLSFVLNKKPSELTAMLGDSLFEPGKVEFMPYLSGERTPHNDANIRGGFLGIGMDTSEQDLVQAVLEGVAFGLRDSREALCNAGANPQQLTAIGGGMASDYWCQLIATVLNIPLHLPSAGEFGAALGAARLGWCAATGADPTEIMTPPRISKVIEPNQPLVQAFDQAYRRYRQLYPMIGNRQ